MQRSRFALFSIWVIITFSACGIAGGPQIAVKGVTIVPSDAIKGSAASFMYIINDGRGDDRLTGCSIKEHPEVYVVLHDVVRGKMMIIKEIKIPARHTTALEKGGLHVMFDGFPDNPADEMTLVLNFEKSGPIEVRASIL
jgi:copper(I)-binding protein